MDDRGLGLSDVAVFLLNPIGRVRRNATIVRRRRVLDTNVPHVRTTLATPAPSSSGFAQSKDPSVAVLNGRIL
jgi:hypothetical protein